MPKSAEDIKLLIRTRHAVITINTLDEAHACRQIHQAGTEMGLAVLQ